MAHVLVVEDNRNNLDLMVYLLRAFGHEVTGLTDPRDAVEVARREHFDLVLADILMPGMDGFELARCFKSDPQLKDDVLVAVTALAMVGDRERIMKAGFDGYISKPIDPQNFVMQVDEFLPPQLRSMGPTITGSTASSSPDEQRGPLILVVDDVQTNLEVIGSSLRPFGYQIIEAHNAREAIKMLERTLPALILCDVHMHDGDGFELLERVKGDLRLRTIPFMFMSSTVWQTSERRRGLELGATCFLLRPIDPRILLDEVRSALGASQLAENPHR